MNVFFGKIRIGDCIKIMRKLPNNSINGIITDPPYNASNGGINLPNNKTGGPYYKVNEEWDKFKDHREYLTFSKKWIKESDRILVENGSIVSCASLHNIGELIISLKEYEYKILNIITWKKTNPMPNITRRSLTHSTEFIVWGAKGKNWTFNYNDMKKYNDGKQLRDVWRFPVCQGKERIKNTNGRAAHPTQKPLKLIERLVEMSTNKNDVVLDPFIGMGTTAIASIGLKRQWMGIEKNKEYVIKARERIKECKNKN